MKAAFLPVALFAGAALLGALAVYAALDLTLLRGRSAFWRPPNGAPPYSAARMFR